MVFTGRYQSVKQMEIEIANGSIILMIQCMYALDALIQTL